MTLLHGLLKMQEIMVFVTKWTDSNGHTLPELQFLDLDISNVKVTFVRETHNMWGYSKYGWTYWEPILPTDDFNSEDVNAALDLLKKYHDFR